MADLMHHKGLRVNAPASTDDEQMAILAIQGWKPGPHPDTDPDDLWVDVPRVLPPVEPEPVKATKATSKKAS